MDHIPQARAEEFQNGNVISWEYATASETMNVARIRIEGRYPEEGFTSNREVDSIIHILGGRGLLGTKEGARVELAPHDQVHLAVGDAYYFEGNLELIYSATPKWTPGQTTHVNAMTHSEIVPKPDSEPNKELLDDNARKFIVKMLDQSVLEDEDTHYLLVTDWLEMGGDTEKKLAHKKYPNGEVQILLISKVTTEQGRTSQKQKISEEQYEALLRDSIRHVEKVRHELNFAQGGVYFELKYDEFENSDLRILEVDAKTDEERAGFSLKDFPGELTEVTGDIRYYGYRVGDVLNS